MLSQRLQDFLLNWCNPETDPAETARILRGAGAAYYEAWLPQELLAAAKARELTPESMAWHTGLGFADQEEVDGWLRTVWPMWFGTAFPED